MRVDEPNQGSNSFIDIKVKIFLVESSQEIVTCHLVEGTVAFLYELYYRVENCSVDFGCLY